MLQQQT